MRPLHLCAYVSIGLSALGSALLGWLYYDLYWRWRAHFNSEGRYFDEESMVVYHQQSSALAIPLALCGLWLFASLWLALRRKRKPS